MILVLELLSGDWAQILRDISNELLNTHTFLIESQQTFMRFLQNAEYMELTEQLFLLPQVTEQKYTVFCHLVYYRKSWLKFGNYN